jgi:N-acetylmuramoyl-L-alanine amidase
LSAHAPSNARQRLARGLFRLAALVVPLAAGVAHAAPSALVILTATQRREAVPLARGEAELLPLDDVLAGSGVSSTTDAKAGSGSFSRAGHELVLHHGKSLASVDGDLKLLSSPALLEGGRWLVPVDALPRLLAPLLGEPVQWRAGERVLVVGNVAVPRVSVSTFLSADLARVVFDASEPLPFRVQQEQGRISVSVARDLLDVSLQASRLAGGIVESIQYAGGRDNVFTVTLGPRFRSLRASEQEAPARLVLELSGPPVAAGERAPAPGLAGAATPRPAPAPPVAGSELRTIVIDPGHGGEETGARGPGGTLEKDVALAIARKLRAELVNARGLQVFLTRDKDAEVELDERAAIANNYKADLFLSIHANASRARGAKGSEVYFLSYQASDDESRRTAQLEGLAEPLAQGAPGSELGLILWDMAQAEHLEESSALASRLQEELAVLTGSEGRGVKQAPFRVLVGAAMPAALVEIAFISNPEEEKLLSSDAYQAKVAGALARGIERFRRERLARLGAPAAAAPAPGPRAQ